MVHRAVVSVEGLGKTPMNFLYENVLMEEKFFTFNLPGGTTRKIATRRIRYIDFFEVKDEIGRAHV